MILQIVLRRPVRAIEAVHFLDLHFVLPPLVWSCPVGVQIQKISQRQRGFPKSIHSWNS